MKISAIVFYSAALGIGIWNLFDAPHRLAIAFAMGVLIYHSGREIRNWMSR